jgi:carotenoid cleavage dioxygenase
MKRRTFVKSLGAGLAFPGMLIAGNQRTHSFCLDNAPHSESWLSPRSEIACSDDASFYLSGNFAPVQKEITATQLMVLGELPKELNGRYLRNGPNPFSEVDPKKYHWFIGDGMVHGVRLSEGKALWYRNRFVRNQRIVEALGEDPACRQFGSTPNTHVIGHACRTWAIMESGAPPVALSYHLDTLGADPFFGTLPDGSYTGHPKVDPNTGHLHAMTYHWQKFQDHVRYVHLGQDGRVKKTLDIPLPGKVMMHDMSLTQRYIVIYDLPVTISLELIEQGMHFPYAWNEHHQARVGLLPREGTVDEIIWIEVPPCYVAHAMNAHDDEAGNVVLDLCRYEAMFVKDIYGPLRDQSATLDRWIINPISGSMSEERIDETPQEFPRCHPALNSKPYRYGYSVEVAAMEKSYGFPCILKHDLVTGAKSRHDLGPGRHGGEPYFVPREGATAEDDGYLMTFVYDHARCASELLVLDARDLNATPLAQVMLPVRVPYGFHGSWVADDQCGPNV